MAELLIEIGCEDLPAGSVVPMAESLQRQLCDVLVAAKLVEASGPNGPGDLAGSAVFATPRRIAVRFPEVAARQPDRDVERKGPALAAAYDADGQPTRALAGFLGSAGASVDDVATLETPKGEWIVVRQRRPGASLADIVDAALPGIVQGMPMPRRMRWGAGEAEFLRPVVWLLALHGSGILPLSLFDLAAGNVTYGHRFHAPVAIYLDDPSDYEHALERANVMADVGVRRARVVDQVERVATEAGGVAVMDAALVDEVTSLVEWPVALAGRFDERFLEIPAEALIQTMEENQRYFALRDAGGELMNAFVFVANIESRDPAIVVDGNERVIRPRFADTMFFWNQDRERTLASLRPALSRVLFQEMLGSVGDKVERLESLVTVLAPMTGADADETRLAAGLCKSDLVSAIVEELPKMQGIAGRYYAARDGHPPAVAVAMEEHYFPKQAGAALPSNAVAQTLALADKVDTLVGIHGQGLVPSGAKDPFALRRASLGIVRILREGGANGGGLDIDVAALIAAAARGYAGRVDDIAEPVIVAYVVERLRGHLVERGASADAVDAVLAKGVSHPLDIDARLVAIERFRTTPAAASLAAATKRIGNILRKAATSIPDAVDADALTEPAERALADALDAVRPDIEERFAERDYAGAMAATATLREPVDAFFDTVMVMAEDRRLRDNRLALLRQVATLCGFTAELSRLDVRGDGE